MKQIIFSQDRHQMNWLRDDFPYASVKGPKQLDSSVANRREGDRIYTQVTLTNRSEKPLFTDKNSIRISVPLQDRYEGSGVCLKWRCHMHIFCGDDVTYIMALRMGGEAPHLGLYVTEGSFSGYSIERDLEKQSNDRGCAWLHVSPMELLPGESKTIRWVIFPHNGKEDFYQRLMEFPGYVHVSAGRYVLFAGEKTTLTIRPSFEAETVSVDGRRLARQEDGSYCMEICGDAYGEKRLEIAADGVHTWCRLLVQLPLRKLAENRCRFIADRQQYHGKYPGLFGAYLIYDNEEQRLYYDEDNDHNGGRERVGMGVLMAKYLQTAGAEKEKELDESLRRYIDYVRRELLFRDTGEISNEMGHDNRYKRLYNFPWFSDFFLETYRLYGEPEMLEDAFRIIQCYYRMGGKTFYPIGLPVLKLVKALREAGMEEECREAERLFREHADKLAEEGLHYPKSEVNYEQSIVAPAADILLQVCLLTQEDKYLEAGKVQLAVLEQFCGQAPDYHLYETAVRHWDGYWFGKRRLYGDTFPHYWSALNGSVYALYAEITKDSRYRKMAEDSVRGVLPMFFADGSASCAYLYPDSVNGEPGCFYDPYANDQDWGLYFNLCLESPV